MTGRIKTIVAGFAAPGFVAWTTVAGFLGEPLRTTELSRVVASFRRLDNPDVKILVPMTSVEARRTAAWLLIEADRVDRDNEGFSEPTEPRVLDPEG